MVAHFPVTKMVYIASQQELRDDTNGEEGKSMSIKPTIDTSTSTPSEPRTAKLTLGGKTVELDVRSGSTGPDVIDIAKVYRDTGCFTYDPGFTSTANCSSRMTIIEV